MINLSRQERLSICNALNFELKRMARAYEASCERNAPNLILFHQYGALSRLRDKVLTGFDCDTQAADDLAVAYQNLLRGMADVLTASDADRD